MLFSLLLLTACKVDRPDRTTVSADVQTTPPKQQPGPVNSPSENTSASAVDNVKVTDQSVVVKLPALKTQSGVGTYCYLQEMPTTLDVGMTGLQFYAPDSIDFISIKGVRPESTTAEKGQWSNCSEFGRDDSTVPLYEVVGVELADSEGKLFNGFNWISLPEKTAFSFPGTDLWLVEVQVPGGSQNNLDISLSVSTTPKAGVEQWAGIFEFKMESLAEGSYESTCTLPEDLNILSVFGHSEPSTGTWAVTCGKEDIFSVDAEQFAGDIPPLKNFATPKSIESGTTCSIGCDWGDTTGQMCEAIVVATSIESPIVCVDGELRR